MTKNADIDTRLLIEIRDLLRRIEQNSAPPAPNYRRRLSEFDTFNWSSIGAKIVASDERGPVEVEWAGHRFDRAGGDKFGGEFLIFSRPAPNWSQENKKYYTLIKFADYNKTPLHQDQDDDPPTGSPASAAPVQPRQSEDERYRRRLADKKRREAARQSPPTGEQGGPASPHIAQPISRQEQPTDGHATWNKIIEISLMAGKFDHKAVNEILQSPADWLEKAKLLATRLGVDFSLARQPA